MLDLTNEFGSKLWLGGSKAGTDTNLMIKNGIGAVWPAAKSVQPDDTAAIRVLRYTDGTGVVHGNPDLPSVLASVDNVILAATRRVGPHLLCQRRAPQCYAYLNDVDAPSRLVCERSWEPRRFSIVTVCSHVSQTSSMCLGLA